MSAAVVAGLIATAIWTASTGLFGLLRSDEKTSSLVGGCAPFTLFAQNQFDPFGAKIRLEPRPDSETEGSFAPNETIIVDGWVRGRSPYPTNTPPWNSGVWFHLSNNEGWVAFAAVRAVPTDPSQGNFAEGSDPAPLDQECAGSIRT